MAVVVVDPGHGGSQKTGGSSPNNATGPGGTKEKTLTLDLAQRAVLPLTVAGHRVRLTRDRDVNLGLADRAHLARDNQADVFVSVHFNGNEHPRIQGTETWHHSLASPDSKLLAAAVQRRLVAATGYRDRGLFAKELGVLNPDNHVPGTAGCLAEVSFLTDPADEERLKGAAYKDALAAALAQGIGDYLAGRSPAREAAAVAAVAPGQAPFLAALVLAVERGHLDVVEVLLEAPDRLARVDRPLLSRCLGLAAARGHAKLVKRLLGAGADSAWADESGWTALMHSAAAGKAEVVRILLAAEPLGTRSRRPRRGRGAA